MSRAIIAAAALAVGVASSPAWATTYDTYGTYGDTTLVSPGPPPEYDLLSDTSMAGYAGIYVTLNAGTLLDQITSISADYEMTQGTFNAGAPRFSIIDTTNNANNEAYVFWGTPGGGGSFTDPNQGSNSLHNTGNYASLTSLDLRVQVNGFGGSSTGASYETWAQFIANDGNVAVAYITTDLDGGFAGTQEMLEENFIVTATAPEAVPEPGSLALLGTGLATLGFIRRRKRA